MIAGKGKGPVKVAIIDLETRRPLTGREITPEDLEKAPVGSSENRTNPSERRLFDEISGMTEQVGTNQSASISGGEAFSSLLNEITIPKERAEDETKAVAGRWNPKELRPRHREMMRRILEGATYVDIAEEMGLHYQTVMLICSSSMFKEELKQLDAELNLDVIRRAEELSNEALDKLKVLMRKARSEALQASCAERVLGIAGYSKIEKKQVQVVSGADVIRELNRRRREAAEQRADGDSGETPRTLASRLGLQEE